MANFYTIGLVWISLPSGDSGVLNSPLLKKRLAKREDADSVDTRGSPGSCGGDWMMTGRVGTTSSGFMEMCTRFSGIGVRELVLLWSAIVAPGLSVHWSVPSCYRLICIYLSLSVHASVRPEPMWELLVNWYLGHDDMQICGRGEN